MLAQNCVGILCLVKTKVWEYVMVKQQGCNALCVPEMLDIANTEYLSWDAGQVTHYIRWSYIAVSPFKRCLFFFFFNILKLFCVGFANASIFVVSWQ